ncbi:MAG: ribosome silencing factor [Ruminococcaceae bacterium]|nr:ribosome silencing factor [Oscillospiraceae bacterium]
MTENININEEEVVEIASTTDENDISPAEVEATARKIAQILYSKKAHDIQLLCVNRQTVLADYFVIAHGTSNTQVKALSDEVVYQLGLEGIECLRTEGYDSASWILLDFGSIIVHVFQKDTRDYFKLEKLWADADKVELELNLKSE